MIRNLQAAQKGRFKTKNVNTSPEKQPTLPDNPYPP